MNVHVLNVRYLPCPLPVVRAQQKIEHLDDGDTLLVIATDPAAFYDIPAWCRIHGHEVTCCEDFSSEVQVKIKIHKTS